jgi:cell division initiation protein
MRLTPLEIENHHFSKRFSGLDASEVETFLKMVAEDYEALVRENEGLSDRVHQLESRVEDLGKGETVLRQTLVSAQDMSDKLRQTAVREAEVLLSESEARAEKIIDASHRRVARLGEDIRELRGLRKRLATALRSTIESHLSLIETLDQDLSPVPERDPASELRESDKKKERRVRLDAADGHIPSGDT